ncbi:thioredoxin [Hymenobacter sp. BT770]|uniref:thioredoxin n=1 Tax=Hymenobacter sp. BT770 TaxID=2886942 RepID=UPI001D1221C3|nr:thioredoxin [Hymenobacter sp. BT770]MCC3155170.1 thioredoxin [Hymenobacter sp. BT770]MDO3417218.1 thioredoxin [Hymenobacter sp. BT770]
MAPVSTSPVLLGTAVLLVLLPPDSTTQAPVEPGIRAALRSLQDQLGSSIRVLTIDEASHPAVVRSFGLDELPACVLVRQGVELWRQQGLPAEDGLASTLLSKVSP